MYLFFSALGRIVDHAIMLTYVVVKGSHPNKRRTLGMNYEAK